MRIQSPFNPHSIEIQALPSLVLPGRVGTGLDLPLRVGPGLAWPGLVGTCRVWKDRVSRAALGRGGDKYVCLYCQGGSMPSLKCPLTGKPLPAGFIVHPSCAARIVRIAQGVEEVMPAVVAV